MKNIVVLGATGDTGKYFIEYLLDNLGKESKIYACGRRSSFEIKAENLEYCQVDITDKENFSKLPDNVYAVVNLAGYMPARMEGYDPYKHIDINLVGNLNVLEYCRKAGADRVLFAQSFGDIKDYGDEKIYLTPDMQRNFKFNTDHTIYVMCKNFTVDLMENYWQMYGIKKFVFRLPTIYLYSKTDTYYVDGIEHKIGYRKIIDSAIEGKPIEIWGDSKRVKDMIYVKDFCQMLYKALFVDRDGGYYNVGTGIGTTLEDQIRGIVEVFSAPDNKSPITYSPEKPNAPQYVMDITSAKNELGYEPKYDYISMLKDFKQEMFKERG